MKKITILQPLVGIIFLPLKKVLWLIIVLGYINAEAQTFNYVSPVPPTVIPDNNTIISFPIVVSGLPGAINSSFGLAELCITIMHPQTSDLKISLRSPNGLSTMISQHNGSSSNFISTCFAMNAPGNLMAGFNPFTGSYLPDQSLNILNSGQDPNGTWYVDVIDEFPFISGTFNQATLSFSVNPPPDPVLQPGVCNTTNASGCMCKDTTTNDCDLLPDLICSYVVIRDGWNETPGHVDLPNAVIDVGAGPIEMKPTGQCFCDTVSVSCTLSTCPNGNPPKERVNQRIYHKNPNGTMTFTDTPAGYQSFHPSHNHVHAEDFAQFSLRVASPDPDPTNWPIIGSEVKQSYCMINMGTCNSLDSVCISHNQVINNSMLPNLGLGSVTGCGSQGQGIYVGNYDIYSSGFGQVIDVPGICNGDYFIVTMLDPYLHFQEEDETNNYVAVPVHLTQQSGAPLNASFTYSNNGYNYAFFNFTNGVTRTWDFGDGTIVTAMYPTHTFAGPGTYNIKLTVFNGTCASTAVQTLVILPVGIATNESGVFDFNVMPNPAKDNFSIAYQLVNSSFVSLDIVNLLGEKVRSLGGESQLAGKHVLDVSDLQSGTYFVRLTSNDKTLLRKIIKL